jgi:hypothetical protein
MGVKRRAKILCGLIAAAVVMVVALSLQWNSSKRAVAAYKQQLLAQGEKLKVSELAPVPPAESFEAAQTFMSAMGIAHMPSNYLPTMKLIGPGCAMVAWQQEILPEDKVSNIWPGLSLELQASSSTLSNLQSALNVPVLYFDLDYSKGFGVLLYHLAKLKQAEILASVSAMAALHERKFPEAWTNLHTAVALVKLYKTEPLIISHLVRIAMAQIAISATWEFLQSDKWTDTQLAELQSNWQAVEFFNASEPAFHMERAIDIDTFQLARKSYDGVIGAMAGSPPASPKGLFDDPEQTLKALYIRYRYWGWKASWSYDEELYLLQNHDAAVRSIRSTELSGAFAPASKELAATIAQIDKLHTNATAHFMLDGNDDAAGIGKAVNKFADAEVGRRLLVTAIALKRYQLRHGNYPADLKALVPEFLRQVPVDLMDGQPLRYHPKPDGNFLLYSVGEDGKDNGGDPTPTEPASTKSKVWFRARDAVWPQPATAEEIAAYFKKNPTAPPRANQAPINANPKKTNSPAGSNATGK